MQTDLNPWDSSFLCRRMLVPSPPLLQSIKDLAKYARIIFVYSSLALHFIKFFAKIYIKGLYHFAWNWAPDVYLKQIADYRKVYQRISKENPPNSSVLIAWMDRHDLHPLGLAWVCVLPFFPLFLPLSLSPTDRKSVV